MDKWKVLIVDDEAYQREILKVVLEKDGFSVASAENGEKALKTFAAFSPDVVLCDLKLPDMDGSQVMMRLAEETTAGYEFIIFTAHGSIESAVDTIKRGAFDYITKPVEREKLLLTTRRACERLALVRENTRLKKQLTEPLSIHGIVGRHPKMLKVLDFINVMGPLSVTVLITGETGTGKDLVARALHAISPRKDKPFHAINCASMPDTLLESELFGHEKGVFTGAVSQRHGLIESTHGGTLFLDEIGELPMNAQAKLLRFMEEKKIRRIGGKEEVPVDVRLATNKKLGEEIKKGLFREDLFYRFRGFILDLPPLRERASDIYLLAEHFIEKYNLVFSKEVKGIAKDALKILMGYSWHGNVRQLDAVIEKATLLARTGIITPEDLDIPAAQPIDGRHFLNFEFPPDGYPLEEMEREIILRALEKSGGCISGAAKLLQTTYRTVEYRVKKHAIPRNPQRNGETNPPNR